MNKYSLKNSNKITSKKIKQRLNFNSNFSSNCNSNNVKLMVKNILSKKKKPKDEVNGIQLKLKDKKSKISHKKSNSNDFNKKIINKINDNQNVFDYNKPIKITSGYKNKHRKTQSNINEINLSKMNLNKNKIYDKIKKLNNNPKLNSNWNKNKIESKKKKSSNKINKNAKVTQKLEINLKKKFKKIKNTTTNNNINRKHVKNKISLNFDNMIYNKNLKKYNDSKIKINLIKSQNFSQKKNNKVNSNLNENKKIINKNKVSKKINNNNNNKKKKTHKKNLSMPFEKNNKLINNISIPIDIKKQKISMTPDISYKNTIIENSKENSIVSYQIENNMSVIENSSDNENNNSKTKRINKQNSNLGNDNYIYSEKKRDLIKKIKTFSKINKNEIIQTSLDFYEIKKLLGEGSYGKVYLAESILLKKECAIKCYNKSKIKSKNSSNKIFQEIKILQDLNGCDNIIKLFEIFDNKNYIFIVLEFMKDSDLFTNLKNNGAWKKEKVLILFKKLIKGLYNIHNNNILHRDIKLDNILLDLNNLNVKIADFGVSKIIKDKKKMIFDFIGTPAYLAPEIIKNKGYKGFGTDIWSLGISIYFLLYGNVPFNGDTIDELYKNIEKNNFEFQDDVQEIDFEFKKIITQMLTKDTNKRLNLDDLINNKYLFSKNDIANLNKKEKDNLNVNKINKIQNFGFLYEDILYTLENKKMNHIFSLYNLLD